MSMKKRIAAVMLIMLIVSSFMSICASADMGPKPSVNIEFPNTDKTFYVTLLSEYDSTGPYSHDGLEYKREGYKDDAKMLAAFDEFAAYNDKDGFYFLGFVDRCNSETDFSWSYYPPSTFKILVYFPDTDSFSVSGIMDRYAFNSYFTAEVSGGVVTAEKHYDYFTEIFEMLTRIAITLMIEIIIALAFGIFNGRRRKVILLTNLFTQVILNIALNIICYNGGWMTQMFCYFLLELAVFVIEGVLYMIMFGKLATDLQPAPKVWKTWLYALAANAASFVLGMMIIRLFM